MRAAFDDSTITVYQAYSPQVADAALAASRFAPPFSRSRMTGQTVVPMDDLPLRLGHQARREQRNSSTRL